MQAKAMKTSWIWNKQLGTLLSWIFSGQRFYSVKIFGRTVIRVFMG